MLESSAKILPLFSLSLFLSRILPSFRWLSLFLSVENRIGLRRSHRVADFVNQRHAAYIASQSDFYLPRENSFIRGMPIRLEAVRAWLSICLPI